MKRPCAVARARPHSIACTRTSCREALRKIIAWRARHELPLLSANTAAYCTARVRMPLATLAAVHDHMAVELFFRNIKTSLRMDVLSGKSPAMIRCELCLFAIACNLVRALMQKAAHAYALDLTRISFKGTVDTIRQWCATCADALANPRLGPRLYAQLIYVIATDRVPLRSGRAEPRAVKRRPKSYNQPWRTAA